MKKTIVANLHKASVLLGGFLTNIPIAVVSYWGNLSTYTDSYFLASVGENNHTTGSLWMITVWIISMTVGVTLSGLMSRKFHLRLTLLAGIIIYNVGVYTSFLTLQSSFWSLHITFGVLTGIGAGFCYSMTLVYAAQWFKTRVGLASAVITSSFGGGSIIFNLATTVFINPQNLEPDVNFGESKYFSQDEIINRVPYVFFVLGALVTGFHVIAFPLMRTHPDCSTNRNIKKSTCESSLNNTSCVNDVNNSCISKINSTTNTTELFGATASVDLTKEYGDQHQETTTENTETDKNNRSIHSPKEAARVTFTFLAALKTKTLYLLAGSLALLMIGFIVESSSYKQFGVLYISDDYFLANIGVGINVAMCVSRILWGFTVDAFELKYVLISVSTSHGILSVFWYFTPFVDKWLYLIWTLAVLVSQSGSVIAYPIYVLKFFGSDHYMTICGIMSFWGIFVHFTTPAVGNVILTYFGWFWLFFLVSAASFVALILIICLPVISIL